ncbi:MAG: hypothetical protein L0G27_08105, partial [Paracoccus sp. (in: a-proteobacteria)]|nr:hypothetical protein [Paracoccus sp. (in: a-proteobacteria)]
MSEQATEALTRRIEEARTAQKTLIANGPGIWAQAGGAWQNAGNALFGTGDSFNQRMKQDLAVRDSAEMVEATLSGLGVTNKELAGAISGTNGEFGYLTAQLDRSTEAGMETFIWLDGQRRRFQNTRAAVAELTPGYLEMSDLLKTIGDEAATATEKSDAMYRSLQLIAGINPDEKQATNDNNKLTRELLQAAPIDQTKGASSELLDNGRISTATENGQDLEDTSVKIIQNAVQMANAGKDINEIFSSVQQQVESTSKSFGIEIGDMRNALEYLGYNERAIQIQVGLQGADDVTKGLAEVWSQMMQIEPGKPKVLTVEKDFDPSILAELRRMGADVTDLPSGQIRIDMDDNEFQMKLSTAMDNMIAFDNLKAMAGIDLDRPIETLSGGDQMTVVVNHFKSKGGSGEGADADAGDGAGNFNNQRVLAAQALDNWLGTNPTGSDTPNLLLLGDLNSYASEDPLAYLVDTAGFVDLAAEFVELGYSYLFDAMLGGLDYALASLEMFNHIVDAIEWNINSDEADALDYNLDFGRDPSAFDGDTPYRASDHDPIVVGIDFDKDDSPVTPDIYDGASFEGDLAPTGALSLDHKASFSLEGAEISAHAAGRLYVTASTGLQIVDITDPSAPVLTKAIDFTAAGFDFATTDITSVATNGSVVAVALPADPKTDAGQVVILDLDGNLVTSFDTGALPDMLTFTPDGTKLLVANEGEPVDLSLSNPKGGVTVIDLVAGTAMQVDFTAFDGQENALRQAGVRIFDGQSVSDDLEPEYIAVSADGLTAMVTLQEANAVAVLDLGGLL